MYKLFTSVNVICFRLLILFFVSGGLYVPLLSQSNSITYPSTKYPRYYSPGVLNYNDAQLWENLYYETNLIRRLNIHVNEEGRIIENMTRPNYIYTDWGITYKFRKYLHFSIDYVPIAYRQLDNSVFLNHQFYFDWVLKLKYGKFIFYDRQMFQSQYGDVNRSENWNVPEYYLRHKVTVKYKLSLRYTPYVASELYYHDNVNQFEGQQVDRMRYFVGCFYWLDTINELEVYYLFEHHLNIPSPYTNFVIGLGYAHNLF